MSEKLHKKIQVRVREIGFETVEDFLSARLSRTLKEISSELDVCAYSTFQTYHRNLTKKIIERV